MFFSQHLKSVWTANDKSSTAVWCYILSFAFYISGYLNVIEFIFLKKEKLFESSKWYNIFQIKHQVNEYLISLQLYLIPAKTVK